MFYIRLFDDHSGYTEFVSNEEMLLPNVSYCDEQNEVHYNPLVDTPKLIVTYRVTDATLPTKLYYCNPYYGVCGSNTFTEAEIDGVVTPIDDLDYDNGQIQFSEGTHVVNYTLKYPTQIGVASETVPNAFYECTNLSSAIIPGTVESIGYYAFAYCDYLQTVMLPDSVTGICTSAFEGCENLSDINIPSSVTSIGDYAFCECPLDSDTEDVVSAINQNALECS